MKWFSMLSHSRYNIDGKCSVVVESNNTDFPALPYSSAQLCLPSYQELYYKRIDSNLQQCTEEDIHLCSDWYVTSHSDIQTREKQTMPSFKKIAI